MLPQPWTQTPRQEGPSPQVRGRKSPCEHKSWGRAGPGGAGEPACFREVALRMRSRALGGVTGAETSQPSQRSGFYKAKPSCFLLKRRDPWDSHITAEGTLGSGHGATVYFPERPEALSHTGPKSWRRDRSERPRRAAGLCLSEPEPGAGARPAGPDLRCCSDCSSVGRGMGGEFMWFLK